MPNKFKVGDLIESDWFGWRVLGIVLETGLDYPDSGERRSRFALVQWSNGRKYHLWKDYGNGYAKAKVIKS